VRKSPIKRYWRVWRFDGYKTTFEKRVDLGQFTENQIKELLRALESRSLSDDEIIGAYAKRKTRIANNLLHIHKDFAYPTYMCGEFAASVVDQNNKVIKHPVI